MSSITNLRAEATPEDRSLRLIIAICAKHGLAYGSPDSLRGFMQALDENKHLAMDFWSMIARLSERGPGDTADPNWLLTIIVEGVTGQSAADLSAASGSQRLRIQKLSSMLAGEDVQPPVDPKPVRSAHKVHVGPTPFGSSMLAPVFSALVREPDHLSSYGTGRRLTLEPDPPIAAASDSGSGHPLMEPQLIIPLASYADANHANSISRKLVGGVLLAALVIGGGLLLARYRDRLGDSISAGYASAIAAWNKPQGVQQPAFAPQPASVDTAGSTSAASQSQPNAAPQNASITQRVPSQPDARATRERQSSQPINMVTAGSSPRASDNATAPLSSARVVVPEILMKQNLISSDTPPSAEGIREHDAQGQVVMQAIVTRRGEVSHVRVLGGDPALRHAAIDAALSRRYQPYLLNGTPVDVSTTISVDFPGNR